MRQYIAAAAPVVGTLNYAFVVDTGDVRTTLTNGTVVSSAFKALLLNADGTTTLATITTINGLPINAYDDVNGFTVKDATGNTVTNAQGATVYYDLDNSYVSFVKGENDTYAVKTVGTTANTTTPYQAEATVETGTSAPVTAVNHNKQQYLTGANFVGNDATIFIVGEDKSDNGENVADTFTVYTGIANLPEIKMTANNETLRCYNLTNPTTKMDTVAFIDLTGVTVDVADTGAESTAFVFGGPNLYVSYTAATATTPAAYTYTVLAGSATPSQIKVAAPINNAGVYVIKTNATTGYSTVAPYDANRDGDKNVLTGENGLTPVPGIEYKGGWIAIGINDEYYLATCKVIEIDQATKTFTEKTPAEITKDANDFVYGVYQQDVTTERFYLTCVYVIKNDDSQAMVMVNPYVENTGFAATNVIAKETVNTITVPAESTVDVVTADETSKFVGYAGTTIVGFFQADGTTPVTDGELATGMLLKVIAADGATEVFYTVTVTPAVPT